MSTGVLCIFDRALPRCVIDCCNATKDLISFPPAIQ
jgi:hypothetical protein